MLKGIMALSIYKLIRKFMFISLMMFLKTTHGSCWTRQRLSWGPLHGATLPVCHTQVRARRVLSTLRLFFIQVGAALLLTLRLVSPTLFLE